MRSPVFWKRFTLIELMIVIAVIAILAALLLPALARARESAKRAVCLGLEKQQGMAMALYIDENDDVFPDHRRQVGGRTTGNWHDRIVEYMGYDYDTFLCPSRPFWISKRDPSRRLPVYVTPPHLATHYMPYGYNGFWLGYSLYRASAHPTGRNFTKIGDVHDASQLIVIADSQLSRGDSWAQSLWYPSRISAEEGVANPHLGMGNVVFADGHAKSCDADRLNADPDYDDWWKPDPKRY